MDDVCRELVTKGADSPRWAIITSAPSTSQVIGTLAALVFGAVVVLFERAPASEDSDHYRYTSRALMTLLYAFFSLALTSFLFSVISGEEDCRRAFAEGSVAGALFGISASGMFLSICWLFAANRIGGPQVVWVKRLLMLTVVTVWTFSTLTTFDATQAIEPGSQDAGTSGVLWWGVLPIIPTLVLPVAMRFTPHLRGWLYRRATKLFEAALGTSIVGAFLAIAGFAWLTSHAATTSFPLAERFVIMGITAITLFLYALNTTVIQRTEPPEPSGASPPAFKVSMEINRPQGR